jgi:hypothetical protein
MLHENRLKIQSQWALVIEAIPVTKIECCSWLFISLYPNSIFICTEANTENALWLLKLFMLQLRDVHTMPGFQSSTTFHHP